MHEPFRFEIIYDGQVIQVEADSVENIHCFDGNGLYLDYQSMDIYIKSKILDMVERHFFMIDAEKNK